MVAINFSCTVYLFLPFWCLYHVGHVMCRVELKLTVPRLHSTVPTCQSQFDQLEYVFLCWYPQKLQLTKIRPMTSRPCKPVTYRTSQRTIRCVIVSILSCFISSNSYSERMLLRLIPCYDLAIALLRCRRRQGARRWLCTGKNVCTILSSLAGFDG
jgi:hypothetical protein